MLPLLQLKCWWIVIAFQSHTWPQSFIASCHSQTSTSIFLKYVTILTAKWISITRGKITHLNKSISFSSITQTYYVIMHAMFGWLSPSINRREYHMATLYIEIYCIPQYLNELSSILNVCYLISFRGTLLKTMTHSLIEWGNNLVNSCFSKAGMISSSVYAWVTFSLVNYDNICM